MIFNVQILKEFFDVTSFNFNIRIKVFKSF